MNWRDGVREREKDEVVNCKRCVYYLPDAGTDYRGETIPGCLEWSRIRGRVEVIGLGFSGVRNDAPFCNLWKEKT